MSQKKSIKVIDEPLYLKIKCRPHSKKEEIKTLGKDHIQVSLREPAEDGRANERLLSIVHGMYPRKMVKIVKGSHSPNKIILIK